MIREQQVIDVLREFPDFKYDITPKEEGVFVKLKRKAPEGSKMGLYRSLEGELRDEGDLINLRCAIKGG
jgi:hypothetical protein